MPLKARVIAGLGALVALMAVSGILSITLLGRLDHAERALAEQVQYLDGLATAATSAKGAANDERGYLLDGDTSFIDEYDKKVEDAMAALDGAGGIVPAGSPERRGIDAVRAGIDTWATAVHKEFDVFAGDPAKARELGLGANRDLRKTYETSLDAASEAANANVAAADRRFAHDRATARTLVIALLVVTLLAATLVGFLLLRSIRRPIAALVERLQSLNEHDLSALDGALAAMAAGDLSVEATPVTEPIDRYAEDEIGQASRTSNELIEKTRASLRSYNEMRAQLSDMIGQIFQNAESVSASSQQMASTSDEAGRAVGEIATAVGDVAQGAERQVRMVESTRTAVQEAARAASASAETAQTTARAAIEAGRVAGDGVEAAEHATEAIRAVAASSEQIAGAIQGLSERSQQIDGIVDTITGIAEQTNLLALNAAIEAARAGEQGRGFAVVAEEVRKLAEDSQDAAGRIAGLIGEIQAETEKVVAVVADGAKRTEDGVATVERTREAFEALGAAVQDMSARVGEIATTVAQISTDAERAEADVNEVASVAEESSASAEQVSASTQQTSASTQEIAASAQSLAHTAEQLNALVGRFKVTA
jgi:methyl-accepting chemotaxis protein